MTFTWEVRPGAAGYRIEFTPPNGKEISFTSYLPRHERYLDSLPWGRELSWLVSALAWLACQPRVITIPLSFDPQHQRDNLAAGDIVLTAEEMARLDDGRPI